MPKINFIAASLVLLACWGVTSANVIVKRTPIDVQYKTFDPANPPKEMPHLEKGEDAVTVSSFRIQAAVNYEPVNRKRNDDGTWISTVDIHGLTITLQLHVVIYTPQGVSEKLKAHEEGHRKIAELIYAERAIPAAKAAGAVLDGKRFKGEGSNWKAAAVNAVNPLVQAMGQDYLDHSANISDEVNNTYDALTSHGTNATTEAEAIKQSLAKYADAHPTTRPAK